MSPLHRGCRIEVLESPAANGEEPDERFADDDCDVRIESGEILVTYWDDLGVVVFAGRELESGRFELAARSRPRRATLELRPEVGRLEGSWTEGARSGAWSIWLNGSPEGDQ